MLAFETYDSVVIGLCNSGVVQNSESLSSQFSCGYPHAECKLESVQEDPELYEKYDCGMKKQDKKGNVRMTKAMRLVQPVLNGVGYWALGQGNFANVGDWSMVRNLELFQIAQFVLSLVLTMVIEGPA